MSYEAFFRTALARYTHSEMVKNEVLRAIITFKDLKPQNSPYGSTYNIPLCIFLPESYPFNPPFILVQPTPSMQIRPGKHVDTAGLVYLPYLHEWSHPRSDLVGLIQILIMIFGEQPPVFSKSPQTPAISSLPYPISSSMPMPGQASSINSFPPYSYQPQSSTNAGGILSETEIRFSMLSAVEDKMKMRLKEVISQSQAEMEALWTTQEDLEKGSRKIKEMIDNINQQQEKLETDIRAMQEERTSLAACLEKVKLAEELAIDDVINATAPIYKQILEAYSEEQAIDDGIYHLSEALRKDVIDLEVFLKQVRQLSRRQFLLRMIINKGRQKAGLSEIY